MDKHDLLWINLTAFVAGVATCAAFISFLSPHTPQFPITCPENNVCYSTDDNTVWEYAKCVIDYGNKLIVCEISEAQVKPQADT